MGRVKVTITVDEGIVSEIDMMARKLHESRSHLIEEAIRAWRRKLLEKELISGYRAMANENLETAEANLAASAEALK